MFVGDTGACPRGKRLREASLGQAPALFTNIRLGWKDFLVTHVLTYLASSSVKKRKGFQTTTPVANVIKLFTVVGYDFS
jgi:hypothetical protein